MGKDKLIERLLILVAVACVAVILASGYLTIDSYKQRLASNAEIITGQKKTIATLAAERDALKNASLPAILPPPPPQNELEQVLEPLDSTSDYQARIDDLKKRYEEILVSYFVLKQCDKTTQTDFHIITSALSQEMASLDAPGRLQYDILTSARGSYTELYSGNQCEAELIDPLYAKYRIFVDSVGAQFQP